MKSEGRKPSILAKSGSRAGAILMYDTTRYMSWHVEHEHWLKLPAIFRRRTFDELIDWIDAFRSYAAQAAVVLILANRRYRFMLCVCGTFLASPPPLVCTIKMCHRTT